AEGFSYVYPDYTLGQFNISTFGDKYRNLILYLSVSPKNESEIYLGMIEINGNFRRKGFGHAILQAIEEVSKESGFKYMTGYHNDSEVAEYFLRRGAYLIDEVKLKMREKFKETLDEEHNTEVIYTVKFFNLDDVPQYIRPERIGTSVESKIEYSEK